MASKNTELYFDPVSQGICEVLGCSNPAKYRASGAQGIVIRLMCATHRAEVEGKLPPNFCPDGSSLALPSDGRSERQAALASRSYHPFAAPGNLNASRKPII